MNIAYQVVGNGPIDLVLAPGWLSNIEVLWEQPRVARFLHQLAEFSRLILFDKRGTGLSDRVTEAATLEERMDDVRAVMDATGSRRAALFGFSEGGAMCVLFAATYPERTASLITAGSFARRISGPGYPWGPSKEDMQRTIDDIAASWGTPVGLDARAPSVAQDPAVRQWWSKFLRMSASPSAAVALSKANLEIDIRHLLPSIHVPTLIVHASGEKVIPWQAGQYLADSIPNAKFALVDSIDHIPFFDKSDELVGHIREFLTGAPQVAMVESSVCTLMLTDIVGSTQMAVAQGDSRFADLLEAHHATVRRELTLYRGAEINTTGDGFLASFDGPARAIKCGLAITKALASIGIQSRVGLHTGECEMRGGQLSGIAIHIAARVASLAPAGGVLVSQTVRDLVAGAGLRFQDAGSHELKGLPERWHLYSVV